MGPLPPALLALLLAVPAAFAQPAFDFQNAEPPLDQELNPYYAQEFLKHPEAQHANALQDADREARLVERATALKDMSDILISYIDPASMNEALRVRLVDDDSNPEAPKLLGFGAHPARLLAWRAKYFDYVPEGRVQLALWEWSTLLPEQRAYLSAPPLDLNESSWEASSFPTRLADLRLWGDAIYERLMKASPKTQAELMAMQNDRFRIWSVMDGAQKRLSGEQLTKASAAVAGMAKLETLPPSVRESSDPQIQSLLAKARAGASPQDTLAALSALFDKAGVHDDSVRTQAPDRPDQKLSSVDPKLFNDMLVAGMRAEIGDVPAGKSVEDFYKTHPLLISVRDLATNLAQFEPDTGAIVFNERFIGDWIKSQGLSAQAVVTDPARFHELVMILAPNFVHESTHKIQKAFADEHGLFAWNAQHQEIEAKEAQSDYMLEKMAKDPAYRQFLLRARDHSFIVQQDLQQTAAFQRDPRTFRAVVMSDYYAGLPSLEAVESATLTFLDSNISVLRDELKRRSALPPSVLAAIDENGKDKDEDFKTAAEWRNYLMTVKTPVVRKLIADDLAKRDKTLKTYELTSAREGDVDGRAEADAQSVIRGDAAAKPDAVPSPGAPR
ncbi:MAG TPA: hypothetical protein VN915_14470 [Elusimicrobiota bacterium]|nr:hypothetical protein [Elusimicrobiota bacterium]